MWYFKVGNNILNLKRNFLAGFRVHKIWGCAVRRPFEVVPVHDAAPSEGKDARCLVEDVGCNFLLEHVQAHRDDRRGVGVTIGRRKYYWRTFTYVAGAGANRLFGNQV